MRRFTANRADPEAIERLFRCVLRCAQAIRNYVGKRADADSVALVAAMDDMINECQERLGE